jgi:mycoredoxin
MAAIKVYGARWCGKTHQTMDYLNKKHVPFEFIDVEKDPAASEWVKAQNGGKEKKPTLDIDGKVVTEPTDEELEELVRGRAA